jgi:hypothetical protein
MAQPVLAIGYSHTPYLFAPPSLWPQIRDRIRRGKPVRNDLPREQESELQIKYQRSQAAFSKLRSTVQKSGAEAFIIIGDDQKELFDNMVPGFAVFTGDRVMGKRCPGRLREVTGNQERTSISNHTRLAEEIVNGLVREGFDVAFFPEIENKEDGFGHAFVPPVHYLMPSLDIPVVPILVNCYYPPQPTPQRCYDFGKALRKVLAKVKFVNRVVVGISGGLWHTPGSENATIDEEFDRQFLELLSAGKGSELAALPDDNLVSGTGEMRNWIVGAGLTGNRKWTVVDYIPLYYSPIGLGFATCEIDDDGFR